MSNDARSKQFLKVLRNEKDELQSMVQRVWNQLDKLGLTLNAIIATSKTQVEMIQIQISKVVSKIVEPERRDTFPAIVLAATFLFSNKNISRDEIVGVLPVDRYVDDKFFARLMDLEDILTTFGAELALMVVQPTFPSEKYGYIVPNLVQSTKEVVKVSHFKEKLKT